jgi:hypothetical protein
MSEHYIQSQYLIKQITNDFFDGKSDTIRIKENKYEVDLDDVSIYSDDSIESLEKVNDERYFYLDSDKEISTVFDICDNKTDILENFTVHVCLYSINNDGFYPFLEYYLLKNENELIFPTFEFKCATNIVSSEGELSSNEVYFQNECMKTILKYATPHANVNLEDSYKGFYYKENTIYVIYDFSFFQKKENLFKVTLFEILNRQKRLDLLISKEVNNLFVQQPSLIYIKDSERKIVKTPHVLYRYIVEDGKHFNETNTDEDDEYMSLIDKPNETLLFGEDNYLFTSIPIKDANVSKLKRYVVFIENPIYSTNTFNEKKGDEGFSLGKVIPGVVNYFQKEEEKDTEEETESKEEEELESDEESEEEEDEDEESEEILNEEEELLKLSKENDSIYYHQNIDGKFMPIWLIKSSRHFIEI